MALSMIVGRRRARYWLLIALATFLDPALADAADAPVADNTAPAGFVALFNGRDLTGWKGLVGNPLTRAKLSAAELTKQQAVADQQAHDHWRVADGVLIYDGQGDSLCTAQNYANFELWIDWKIDPHGDSGIYLRGSPQVQIWDADYEPYFRNGADKGSGSLWNNEKHPRFPTAKADKPAGQWNRFFIKMVGTKVTIDLNGTRVTDNVEMENYWDRSSPIFPTGQIELQHHGAALYFKNIYLRELP